MLAVSRHAAFSVAIGLGVSLAHIDWVLAQGALWPQESLVETEDMGFVSVATGFEYVNRAVDLREVGPRRLVSRSGYGLVSLDLVRWLTVWGGAGATEARRFDWHLDGDEDFLWLAGIRASLWEFPVTSPAFLASRVRLQVNVAYLQHQAELHPGSMEWAETRTALLIGAERLAENWRRLADPAPYSLSLYSGPVWSVIDGTWSHERDAHRGEPVSETFEEHQALGVVGGLTLFITRRFSAGAEARWMRGGDRPSFTAEVALHF